MPFAWFSDDFYDHPKVRALPRRYRNEAVGMFVRLVTLCNRHLTDGVITDADIEAVDGRLPLVELLTTAPPGFRVGLLERRNGTLHVHDFGEYSKTRRQVVADRKKKADAGRKGGIASGKQRRSRPPSKLEAGASSLVEPRTHSHSLSDSVTSEAPTEPRVLLSAEQLAAWQDFSHPRWQPFREAWLAKGFRYPPHGEWDDPKSQRALLWEIADARPDELAAWIRAAPGRSVRDVVGWVLERWHEARRTAARRADAQEVEAAAHKADRQGSAVSLTRIGELLQQRGAS